MSFAIVVQGASRMRGNQSKKKQGTDDQALSRAIIEWASQNEKKKKTFNWSTDWNDF